VQCPIAVTTLADMAAVRPYPSLRVSESWEPKPKPILSARDNRHGRTMIRPFLSNPLARGLSPQFPKGVFLVVIARQPF
jgi:hypothetical protein